MSEGMPERIPGDMRKMSGRIREDTPEIMSEGIMSEEMPE